MGDHLIAATGNERKFCLIRDGGSACGISVSIIAPMSLALNRLDPVNHIEQKLYNFIIRLALFIANVKRNKLKLLDFLMRQTHITWYNHQVQFHKKPLCVSGV